MHRSFKSFESCRQPSIYRSLFRATTNPHSHLQLLLHHARLTSSAKNEQPSSVKVDTAIPVSPTPNPSISNAKPVAAPLDPKQSNPTVAVSPAAIKPSIDFKPILLSGALSFVSISGLSFLHFGLTGASDYTLLVPSFGASAVLLFAAPAAPFSQPRNVIGGHLVSFACSLVAYYLVAVPLDSKPLAIPVAVSLAIMAMQATGTLHPPAGGTAMLILAGSQKLTDMGPMLSIPLFVGSSFLVGSAFLLHNRIPGRKYPQTWW